MKEGRFESSESGTFPGKEGDFHSGNIQDKIHGARTPWPKTGVDFLKNTNFKMERLKKNSAESRNEKMERIKEAILEEMIDLSNPRESYRELVEELKRRKLFDDNTKSDTNYYFNQKLVYLYNKESLKRDNNRANAKEAAFAGARSLHGVIEKLQEIENAGGNDEAIEEYLASRKKFYMELKEKDIEHLVEKEERLLDNLQNVQLYGALAEKAAMKLIEDTSSDTSRLFGEGALKNFSGKDINISVKEASISDDVHKATDLYLDIDGKSYPVQVKCGNIETRHEENEENYEFIMNNIVRLVGQNDRFEFKENGCYYENKIKDKLNRFINKALAEKGIDKGFIIILPRGKGMLKENGDVDEEVRKAFFDQFFNEIAKLEFN